MRNLKLEELFIGAWVQQFMEIPKRFSCPMQISGIFDGGSLYLNFDGNEGDPFDAELKEVFPLQINENLLRGFGFKKTKGDNVWVKQIADMRLTIGLRWKAGVQIARRCAISGKITCWNEEIRYMHELQRWWNDRVYFPYDVPLKLDWKGVSEKVEELK